LKKFQIAIHLLEQEKKKAWKEVPVVPVAPKETVVPIEEKQDSSIVEAAGDDFRPTMPSPRIISEASHRSPVIRAAEVMDLCYFVVCDCNFWPTVFLGLALMFALWLLVSIFAHFFN
jgi:hypothetical protein